jgi:hypothetical protein
MIFVDFLGSPSLFEMLRDSVAEEISSVLRCASSNVVVRRIVIEPDPTDVELWIELSSDEQFVRFGPSLAARISDRVRSEATTDVWVLFRIVPLSQAFLNGQRRARGRVSLD